MEKVKSIKLDLVIDNFVRNFILTGKFDVAFFKEILTKATLSEDRELRRVSCKIIRRLKLKEFLSYVRLLLNDEDFVVRSLALLAVAQFKDEQSLDKVIEAYRSDNKTVKSSALLALGSIDKKETYKFILESLYSENDEVRENAIIAFSWISYPENYLKLIELYDNEKNKNIKNRIVKSFSIVSSEIVNKKLQEILLKENDDIIILTSINSLHRKGINNYSLLADSILIKSINDSYKKENEIYKKRLYEIVSHNFWENKIINQEEQKKIYNFLEGDLVYKYYIRSEDLKRLAISSIKNLNLAYHTIILKVLENDLSNNIKLELISFLANPRVDKNLKILLLEFLNDHDRLVREQALFAILDSQYPKAMLSYINQKIFSMEYTYLKLIILSIIYNSIV